MGTDLSLSLNFLTKPELSLIQKAVWNKIICADIHTFWCIRWCITIKNKTNALRPQWLWCREKINTLMFFYITKLQSTCIAYKTLWLQLLKRGENDGLLTTGWGWKICYTGTLAVVGGGLSKYYIILLRKSKGHDNWDCFRFLGD